MLRKTTISTFQETKTEISHEKRWIWLRKGNLKRETEPLPIAAKNNAIRTNCVKARKVKTQQNSRCKLCGKRDERIYHIINKCNKIAICPRK